MYKQVERSTVHTFVPVHLQILLDFKHAALALALALLGGNARFDKFPLKQAVEDSLGRVVCHLGVAQNPRHVIC